MVSHDPIKNYMRRHACGFPEALEALAAQLAACRTEVFSQALRSAVTGLAEPADLAFSW
jgi:hypothetical protein